MAGAAAGEQGSRVLVTGGETEHEDTSVSPRRRPRTWEKNEMSTRIAVVVAAFLSLVPLTASAHCDTLDGPLLETARKALDANDVPPVLAWVKPDGEKEIRAAFLKAVEARKKNPHARDTADHRFFETLVRVHRTGEGAAYTGLKPAGAGVTPALRAADTGIAAGNGSHVEHMLVEKVQSGLRERFAALSALQPPGADVAAGRKWVEAYVRYVHYVEGLEAAAGGAGAHAHDEHAGTPPRVTAAERGAHHEHAH
jgi:hypothetical protein